MATVARFDQWEQAGFTGLEDKPRSGRPAKLRVDNAEHVKEVKKQVEKESQNLDRVRAQLADDLQVEVSRKTLKRFLKKLVTVVPTGMATLPLVFEGKTKPY